MDVWGFNGSMPGPTIEVNQGDMVRIIVENRMLPEETSIHFRTAWRSRSAWTGVPCGCKDFIPPWRRHSFTRFWRCISTARSFTTAHVAMQEALGIVGLFIVHPKTANEPVRRPRLLADHAGILDPPQHDNSQ